MLTTLDFSQTQCRLTGLSGSPFADANSQALQTIYISPVLEGKITLWTGTKLIQTTISEIAISVASDPTDTMYDIFTYFDVATQSVKYEKAAWSSKHQITAQYTRMTFQSWVHF